MEIYSSTTRFALACNISSKIIEPIQSRCAVVRFSRLSDAEILDRLVLVASAEKVSFHTLGVIREASARGLCREGILHTSGVIREASAETEH